MTGHECYHCKGWVDAGEQHDCWTTTERALTGDLPEDLQDAYARLREAAAGFGDQRIYASHNSIMFARRTCYFFVRPKRSFLEVCIFLGRTVTAPQVRKATRASSVKVAHMLHVRHRDEVEVPVTEWLREAYDLQEQKAAPTPRRVRATAGAAGRRPRKAAAQPAKARAVKKRKPRK